MIRVITIQFFFLLTSLCIKLENRINDANDDGSWFRSRLKQILDDKMNFILDFIPTLKYCSTFLIVLLKFGTLTLKSKNFLPVQIISLRYARSEISWFEMIKCWVEKNGESKKFCFWRRNSDLELIEKKGVLLLWCTKMVDRKKKSVTTCFESFFLVSDELYEIWAFNFTARKMATCE